MRIMAAGKTRYAGCWPLARVLLLSVALSLAGCGYRLAGRGTQAGEGQTLAVPTFRNTTTEFKIEQRLTEAVRRELIQRTRYRVTSADAGDVVLTGEVLNVRSIPIILTDRGRSTAYTIEVELAVRMVEGRDNRVLFANDRWTFREVFELSNDSEEFLPEDTAAVERLARRFARSLVASLVQAQP